MGEAIANSNALIFCASPSSCMSQYVRKEVFFAKRCEKPIIPINITSHALDLPYCLDLELGHLHFLEWPKDGIDRILEALELGYASGGGDAGTGAARLSKALFESDSARLRSLGSDFLKFRRLVDVDLGMAALHAGRIASRVVVYTAETLGGTGERAIPEVSSVFERIESLRLLTPESCTALRLLFDTAKSEAAASSLALYDTPAADAMSRQVLHACETSLVKVLEEMIEYFRNRSGGSETLTSSLRVARGREIDDPVVEQMFYCGRRAFGPEVMRSAEGMKRRFHSNPDIYQALIEESTGICIGYSSVMPLTQEAFERTLHPDFDEKSFSPEDFVIMDTPGYYFLYLSSVVVDSAYRDLSLAYKILFSGYVEYLADLAERDIYVSALSADAITDKGRRVCRSLGMVPIAERGEGSTLFYGTLLPPSVRLSSPKGLNLLRSYQKTWNEFKDVLPETPRMA